MTESTERENGENPMDLAQFAAILAQSKTDVDGSPIIVLPPGWQVEDLSRFLEHPTRKKGTVTLQETRSFIDYVKRHKTSATAVYIDRKIQKVTAVLDDHDPEGAVLGHSGHRDFLAVLPITTSRQWRAWMAHNGGEKDHGALAQFIEDRLDDFTDPPGAEMMELMLSLEAKTSVSFRSGVRLDTGAFSFAYDEEVHGTAKAGALEIPSQFIIAIPVLAKEDPANLTKITVRLRYRLRDKVLAFTLLVRNHEEILEQAIDAWIEMIGKETKVPMYVGSIS